MEEICRIAAEKGFKTKTVSTHVTFNYYIGEGKNMLINDMCDYLLLCEIQKWVREEFDKDILVGKDDIGQYYVEFQLSERLLDTSSIVAETYEEVLKAGILKTLKNE